MVVVRRILMATDFSDYSNEALDHAVYLAQNLEADLYLLHVFEPPFFSHAGVAPSVQREVHQWIEQNKNEASQKLKSLVEEIQPGGVKVSTIFKEGVPFFEILKAAGEISADLIVLGTHGRTGLPHVLLGSVAERVVRKSSCPVLTVRPKALAGQKEKRQ
jgi:nucleotide-binding universal stress UspA family protein